jgi:hypothetical protein
LSSCVQTVPENLKLFGLGEMTLWYKAASRDAAESIDKPAFLIDQIKALSKLIKKDPNNEVSESSPNLFLGMGMEGIDKPGFLVDQIKALSKLIKKDPITR